MKDSRRWEQDFEYGRQPVRRLVTWLKQRNVGVIRADDTGAAAPLFEQFGHDIPQLDLLVFWKGHTEAWDGKAKRDTGYLKLMDIHTTGVDSKFVNNAREFERKTLIPARVVFFHPTRNEVLLARLSDFDPRLTIGNGGGRGERLEYCDIARLEWVCAFSELDELPPAPIGVSEPPPPWLPRRSVSAIQMSFELPQRRPPSGVKGWLQP